MKLVSYLFLLFSGILFSCSGKTETSKGAGDTIDLKYAEHLQVVKHDGYTVAKLVDPWKEGKTLHTYLLVPRDMKMPENMPEGTVIRVPIKSSVVFTSVHCGLMIALGAKDKIKGVCDLHFIRNNWIQQQCKKGVIADCGGGMNANVEKIIDLKPDAIFLSPFENSGGYGRLENINIPLVECADYMETSALGRAEWMKFYGMLAGKEEEAARLFDEIDRNYQKLKAIARKSKTTRSVITERIYGSTWYVPGGRSVAGILFEDAGGKYAFADIKKSGSLSMSFEQVLDKAGNADVWIYKYNSHPANYKELLSEHHGYGRFKAFKTRRIYACDCAAVQYYEEAPFRPDYLLKDLIQIIHPDLKLGKLRYYEPLKQ